MIQNKDFGLIEKYVRGECTLEEENYVFTLFADNEDEKELIKQMQLDWNKTIEQHSPAIRFRLSARQGSSSDSLKRKAAKNFCSE
jgi:hypothetical protein